MATQKIETALIADDAVTSAKLDTNIDIAGTLDVTGATTLDSTLSVSGNITGTLATAAQPNITSLGTLTALTGGTGDLNWDSGTLFVDSSANAVGIGTTSPAKSLEIFGSGSESGILVKNDTNTNYRGIYFGATEPDNASYGKIHMVPQTGELNITSGYSSWGGFITFDTNGSERMRIDASGKVGIGNSAPLGKLTISNAAGNNAPNTVAAANTYLQLGSDDYGPNNDGKFMIGFGYTDATNTNSPAYIGYEETSTSGDTKGALTFYTRDVITDTAPTERMRIDASGNTTFKTSAGHLSVEALGGGSVKLNSNGSLGMNVAAGYSYEIDVGGSEVLRIDNSGAVGIGVVPQTNRFAGHDVLQIGARGTLLANDTGSSTGQTALLDNLFYNSAGSFRVRDGSNATAGVAMQFVEGNVIFSNSAATTGDPTVTERMRIKSDGQITTQGDIVPGADVIMANGRGISFAATANSSGSMSNELLDDYEEGTFTMQFHNNGTNPTVASVENTTAYYTKIGNTVRFFFYSGAINISNIGTGSARLAGLPFNSVGGSYSYSPVTFAHTTAFDSGPTGYTVTGSSYIQCTDALPATAGCQYVTGTGFIMVSGVYQTS